MRYRSVQPRPQTWTWETAENRIRTRPNQMGMHIAMSCGWCRFETKNIVRVQVSERTIWLMAPFHTRCERSGVVVSLRDRKSACHAIASVALL